MMEFHQILQTHWYSQDENIEQNFGEGPILLLPFVILNVFCLCIDSAYLFFLNILHNQNFIKHIDSHKMNFYNRNTWARGQFYWLLPFVIFFFLAKWLLIILYI